MKGNQKKACQIFTNEPTSTIWLLYPTEFTNINSLKVIQVNSCTSSVHCCSVHKTKDLWQSCKFLCKKKKKKKQSWPLMINGYGCTDGHKLTLVAAFQC